MEPINILHLDDDASYHFLVKHHVETKGLRALWRSISTRRQYFDAMSDQGFDIILSDFRMPSFSGDEALALAREVCPEIPFIMVTGELGEDRAIETLKHGAWDYVLKDNLKRLVPAIQRALIEADNLRKRRDAEEKLRESEERFRMVLEHSLDAAYRRNLREDRYDYLSPVIETITGITASEFMSFDRNALLERIHPEDMHVITEAFQQITNDQRQIKILYRLRTQDGTYRWIADLCSVVDGPDGAPMYLVGIVRDITDWKPSDDPSRSSGAEVS